MIFDILMNTDEKRQRLLESDNGAYLEITDYGYDED